MAKRRAKKRLKTNAISGTNTTTTITTTSTVDDSNRWLAKEQPSPPDLTLVNKNFNNLYSAVIQVREDDEKTVKFADDCQQPLIYLKYYSLENNKGQLIETGRTHDDDRTPMEKAVIVNRHYAFALLNYSRHFRTQADLRALLADRHVVVTTLSAKKDIIHGTASVLLPLSMNENDDQQQQQQQQQQHSFITSSRHITSRWSVTIHYTYNEWSTVDYQEARLIKPSTSRTNISRYEFHLKLEPNEVQLEMSKCFAFYVRVTSIDGKSIFVDNNIGEYYLAKIEVDE